MLQGTVRKMANYKTVDRQVWARCALSGLVGFDLCSKVGPDLCSKDEFELCRKVRLDLCC